MRSPYKNSESEILKKHGRGMTKVGMASLKNKKIITRSINQMSY